jgi:hypothetical protein
MATLPGQVSLNVAELRLLASIKLEKPAVSILVDKGTLLAPIAGTVDNTVGAIAGGLLSLPPPPQPERAKPIEVSNVGNR